MLKILFLSVWFVFHPVHVTLTSIDYVPESVSFKVFVRMYFDDFLVDYRKNGGVVPEDGFSDDNSTSVKVMEKYLNDKINIKVNNDQLIAKLQDLNIADNELNMNLVYTSFKKPKTMTVKNLIMTGLYSDQTNMVILRVNDFEEGVKLTSELTEQTFKIK